MYSDVHGMKFTTTMGYWNTFLNLGFNTDDICRKRPDPT